MNKKLLLLSLLSVGMLVGCGGGTTPSSSTTPSSEPPSSTVEGEYDGKFGNSGYYLVGEHNSWNNFWKYEGFNDFLFTKNSDDNYTLVFSVTDELLASEAVAGDTEGALDFKVMYWDGTKAPSQWYPDGVENNGTITEAGEYTFTFNPNSKETATKPSDGSSYTLYTTAVRKGDVNPETSYVQGEAREFDPVYKVVTFKVELEEELTLPESTSVYLYTWSLVNEEGENVSGYFEMTENNGVWSYVTPEAIVVDEGTGLGLTMEFCLLVDEPGQTEPNWDKKISCATGNGGNYSFAISERKAFGTVEISTADKPYWTKGEVTNPYTVAELKAVMSASDYVTDTEYAVVGEVTKVSYQESFDSYNVWLKVDEETPTYEFEIYSGKLATGVEAPEVGDTIVAVGKSKIYTPTTGLPVYELAYSSSHKVSPEIVSVTKPVTETPTTPAE